MNELDLTAGNWLNPPASSDMVDDKLVVLTQSRSDLWRKTHYGFIRDSGHSLLYDFLPGQAIEVTFHAELVNLYDQAGVLIRASPTSWIKAGLELSDGTSQLSTVVTDPFSDWSCSPVPDWNGETVTMRASWANGAVTIRARIAEESWRTVRLAPFVSPRRVQAGLYCASPMGSGMRAHFAPVRVGEPDRRLHIEHQYDSTS